MTDYWKSNEKKYCEFCKCWLTDNKITISTHEGGKKHKENVAKKISEINKMSTKNHKAQMKMDDELSKMERNAMASYMKDIQSNADLTSQLINKQLEETNSTLALGKDTDTSSKASVSSSSSQKGSNWKQMKSDNGNVYYWNVSTNETSRTAPEGFVASSAEGKKSFKEGKHKEHKKKNKDTKQSKSYSGSTSMFVMGPQPRAGDPYGSWTTIDPQPTLDLDLPEQKYTAPTVAPIVIEPEKKFKEKQIVKLEDAESSINTEFKKRKINSNAKRNVRQRLDDD